MSKSIDDRGTEREHELQGMAQALEDRQHHLAQRERSASDQLAALTRREQALNAREQELAVSKEEVEARRQQVTRDSDDRANSARRELAQQAQQLASQEEALVAMRQAIDAREDAVRRREDDMAERLGELRDASTTLRELEVRRIQVRDAIDNLSSVQRRQDETLAETRRRQTQVEALEREVGGREEDLAIQERRLEQWHHDIKEHEASLHQHRAAADMAAAKDKTMFNEASEEIRRRMEQLAETAADLEASSRQVQAREAEVAATLARLEAKEKALQEKALQLQHQPSETHSSASVRAPAMSPVRRYSNQDLSAARRNGHDVAVHHLPAPTPSGARRNTGAAAATPLKHDRDVYRVSSSPADELYDSAVHSRYDSAVQSRSAWSRDAHEVDARHAAYAHEVDAAPCLAQSRGVRDERPSRLRASSHLASAHQAASAQPSGAFEAQSSRYTETEREDQDVIQRHIREQLGAVESRAAEVKKNQAQVPFSHMRTHTVYLVYSRGTGGNLFAC